MTKIPLSTLLCSVTLEILHRATRKKKKANPLLFVNTTVLTRRQAYKGRKFLSPANRDTTMYVFLCPSHKQSESEIKIPLTIMTQT